jgi:hypothetical protein
MILQEPTVIPVKYKVFLAILGLIGVGIILLATNRYGAGISPDSVTYISTARNLISGAGFIDKSGTALVRYPPLYPILLGLVGGIFRTDPLLLANIVNAIIFGLIVYLGGWLTFKHLSSFPALALLGTLAFLFSAPVFAVSVMAWSEPIFILLVLLSLIFVDSYLTQKDRTSLILFASSVALSCLVRYIGIALILWGALIIIFFHRNGLKSRIAHLSLFILISSLPLGIWLIRNYAISSTFFGHRAPSGYTLFQNLRSAYQILVNWYIPGIVVKNSSILMFVSATVGFFIGLSIKDSWPRLKVSAMRMSTIILFIVTYTSLLDISATTSTGQTIDNRYLSPIYIPLTLLLLILTQGLCEVYRKRFSNIIVNSFLIIGLAIWLVYPIQVTIINAKNFTSNGEGYNSKVWKESETIQYLLQHQTVKSECTIYSNGYDAAYILANIKAKASPTWTKYNSREAAISRLKGVWPKETKACLVWFNHIKRNYLLTMHELQGVANLDLIFQLNDGAIYSITSK